MMRMKPIDWDNLAPLGLGGRLAVKRFCFGTITASLISWCVFWSGYATFRDQLYQNQGWPHAKELIPGAVMQPFYQTVDQVFIGFWIVALCMLPLALWHYYYHYQDSRSIYLMHRLPNGWEFWRRCLALPLLGLAVCILLAALHLFLFFAIYWFCTPPQCLQSGQWRMLWQNLFD